jgi:nitrogen fixation/metabolism regulation signal transduction histidine kinase
VSFKQRLFFWFLLLAFLPTATLLIFSYRLATEGADLLAARGVSQTMEAADSLVVSLVANEQQRLLVESRYLLDADEPLRKRLMKVDSTLAFIHVSEVGGRAEYGKMALDVQNLIAGVERSGTSDSCGRAPIGNRLLVWATSQRDHSRITVGRYLSDEVFAQANQVMDGRSHYLSLSKNLLPGSKNLLLKIAIALILVSLIVSLLTAQSLSYSFSSPLERLVDATRQVSRGDLQYRIPITGRDEIGVLTGHFNAMTESLETATQNLIRAEKELIWRENARTVAHEIKNLLTPVNVALFQIRQKFLTEQTTDPQLAGAVDALSAEIDAISDLAKQFAIFAHPAKLARVEVDLGALINQVVALYSGSIERRTITALIEPPTLKVSADHDLLKRVISNLLKNAVEATSESGNITIKATEQPDSCWLEVLDDGIGADDKLDLTQPYLTTKKAGTGLGLAIVKKVCEAHGWTFCYGNLRPGFFTRIVMTRNQ